MEAQLQTVFRLAYLNVSTPKQWRTVQEHWTFLKVVRAFNLNPKIERSYKKKRISRTNKKRETVEK